MIIVNTAIPVSASTISDKNETTITEESSEEKESRGPTFSYYWKVTSTEHIYSGYGAWRNGPIGRGPGILNINESTSLNRNFTANITLGGFPAGKGTIGAALGVTIGQSKSYGTSYSINLGNNERKQIIYKPKHKTMKVTQTQYKMNNQNGTVQAINTEVCYVDVFDCWYYDWQYA